MLCGRDGIFGRATAVASHFPSTAVYCGDDVALRVVYVSEQSPRLSDGARVRVKQAKRRQSCVGSLRALTAL